MMTLIIASGAPQKTSNTVKMYPLAGDIANVSYFKINAYKRDVISWHYFSYVLALQLGLIDYEPAS